MYTVVLHIYILVLCARTSKLSNTHTHSGKKFTNTLLYCEYIFKIGVQCTLLEMSILADQ
jgi:hypothetical protein